MIETSAIITKIGNKIDLSKHFIIFEGEELKIWQDGLYEMLCDFSEVMEENDLKYTLSGGTCLGAVRHQGFIPWDDDLDLNVPRLDYNKMKEAFENSKFKDKYTVILAGEFDKPCIKGVIRRDDITVKEMFPYKNVDENAKMFIDIFSIENIPNNKLLRNILGVFTTALNASITSNGYTKTNNALIHELAKFDKKLKYNIKFRLFLSLLTRPFFKFGKTKNKPIKMLNKLYTKLAENESDFSTIYCGSKRYFGEIMNTEDYMPVEKFPFRDKEFYVPKNYDRYLTNLYGDYMRIPKVDEQKVHFHTFDF